MKITFTLFLFFALRSVAVAQTAITAYTIVNQSPAGTSHTANGWGTDADFSSATTYTDWFGQTSSGTAGTERVVNGFAIGSATYSKIPSTGGKPFDRVTVKRHPSLTGNVINTLFEYSTQSSPNNYF